MPAHHHRGVTSASRSRRRPPRTGATGGPRTPDLNRLLDESCARPASAAESFTEIGVPGALVRALADRGISVPFAIQARAMPDAIRGRDVLGRAQTGSGKTLAFGLPILARLAGQRSRPSRPRALVLVPTRELATQVARELGPIADAVGLGIAAVFGGAPYGAQRAALARGADVVVATPGRLIDMIDRGDCALSEVSVAVLDEADHMADVGFLPSVRRLLDAIPSGGQRLLFSATLDRGVDGLVGRYLNDPAVHAVAAAAAPVEAMDHRVFLLAQPDKVKVAAEIAARPGRTLVFVRTKHGASRLARQLTQLGAPAAAIHGNLAQNARQRALEGFASGHPRVLVATDVAARGIHVDDVDLVVHFDPPNDARSYLHRSGRTARGGASGTVISFVLADQQRDVQRLHADAGVTPAAVPVHPGHGAVRAVAESGTPVPAPRPARPVAAAARPAQPRRRPGRRPRPARHRRPAA